MINKHKLFEKLFIKNVAEIARLVKLVRLG